MLPGADLLVSLVHQVRAVFHMYGDIQNLACVPAVQAPAEPPSVETGAGSRGSWWPSQVWLDPALRTRPTGQPVWMTPHDPPAPP